MTLTVRDRILLTLIPPLLVLVGLGGAGMVLLWRLGGNVDAILRENYDSIVAMEHLGEALERIDSSFQFTLAGQEASGRDQYRKNWTIYRENLRFEQGNVTVPGEQKLVDVLTELSDRYTRQGDDFYARADQALRRQDYFASSGLLATFQQIKAVVHEIQRINHQSMEQANSTAKRTAAVSLVGFAIGVAAAVLLTGLAAWYTLRAIAAPIRALTQSARGLSAGQLDVVVPYLSRDALGELTEAFNHMAGCLRADRQAAEARTRELAHTAETLQREIGERQRMEQSLRQLAAIVESSDDAIIGHNLDGVITSWNKGAEGVFGYPAQAVLGQRHCILVPPEYESELAALEEKAKRGELVGRFESVRRRKDGQRIAVSLTFFPVRDYEGALVGMGSIVRDITPRKRADEALRQAAAYNRRLLEVSLDPLVTIGPDGKITDVNAATEAATGFGRAELLGKDFADYFTEPERARAGYQCVFSEGQVRDYPLRMRRCDGHVTPVLYNAAVYRDEVGNVAGVFAAARDMTQVERAQEALRTSEANLKRAQAVAHIGSWHLDLARDELRWSDENYRIFNLPCGTPLTYERFLACVHPDDRAFVDRAWTAALHGAPYDIEHRIQIDGETRWVREKAEIALDADGRVVSGIGATHDITERKRAEEQLRHSNRALLALSNCNQALIRAAEETSLLQEICQIVVDKAGYRLCWVGYAENDAAKTVRPVAQAGLEDGYLKHVNITWADTERGHGPTGSCIRSGQPVLFRNIASDPAFAPWRAEAQRRGYASCIGMPLIMNSHPFGALTIYASEPDAFSPDEVKLLTELADDLAFGVTTLRTRAERKRAVERQAAHERDLKIGFDIQQTLLLDPAPVNPSGLRLAALTVPSQQIDGDFYHFYRHENGCLDVIVADVMGKGIPAAILAAATKSNLLQALSRLTETAEKGRLPEPREIVTLAHAEMGARLIQLESFVTLCYLRLDRDRCSLQLVDCGHTGLIHRHGATGVCDHVHGNNLALGMRQGEIYEQLAVQVAPGDLLLLYSDGVTETRNAAGELFGEGRLLECVRLCPGEPEEAIGAVRQAALGFSGSETPSDDLTCVAIAIVERELPIAHRELDMVSDLRELTRARAFVRSSCGLATEAGLDEECAHKLELAVSEACANIIKHAYRGRTDQAIHLEVDVFRGKVVVRLHHLGNPFDPSKATPPRLDGSQESGFGVYLIGACVDEVRYYQDERGQNCVSLMKIAKSPDPDQALKERRQ